MTGFRTTGVPKRREILTKHTGVIPDSIRDPLVPETVEIGRKPEPKAWTAIQRGLRPLMMRWIPDLRRGAAALVRDDLLGNASS